jgi:hypothetical protein
MKVRSVVELEGTGHMDLLKAAPSPLGGRLRSRNRCAFGLPIPPHTLPSREDSDRDALGPHRSEISHDTGSIEDQKGPKVGPHPGSPQKSMVSLSSLKLQIKHEHETRKMPTMSRHRIYLREELEKTLLEQAQKLGLTLNDFIRQHLEKLSTTVQMEGVRSELRECRRELSECLKAMEHIAQEVGFSSGVLRSKAARDPDALGMGNMEGKRLRNMVSHPPSKASGGPP